MNTAIPYTPAARWLLVAGLAGAACALPLHSAPSLDVRKPPVVSGANPNTGPATIDPTARRGQWFAPRYGTTAPQPRSHEFYDNGRPQGGSPIGSNAIHGRVSAITYATGSTNIVGFQITAMIRNDSAAVETPVLINSSNSHQEKRSTSVYYRGPLIRPVLAVEFAQTSPALFPTGSLAGTPYRPQPGARILATNHDLHGWYCYNNGTPAGRYFVPSWSFPDIAVGGTAVKVLNFTIIDGGLPSTDPRYRVLIESRTNGRDVLANRGQTLKIGSWVGTIFIDTGVAYWSNNLPSSVSVFHNAATITPLPTVAAE